MKHPLSCLNWKQMGPGPRPKCSCTDEREAVLTCSQSHREINTNIQKTFKRFIHHLVLLDIYIHICTHRSWCLKMTYALRTKVWNIYMRSSLSCSCNHTCVHSPIRPVRCLISAGHRRPSQESLYPAKPYISILSLSQTNSLPPSLQGLINP